MFSLLSRQSETERPGVTAKEHKGINVRKPENACAEVFITRWCGFIIRVIQNDKLEERAKGDKVFTRMRMVDTAFSHQHNRNILYSLEHVFCEEANFSFSLDLQGEFSDTVDVRSRGVIIKKIFKSRNNS